MGHLFIADKTQRKLVKALKPREPGSELEVTQCGCAWRFCVSCLKRRGQGSSSWPTNQVAQSGLCPCFLGLSFLWSRLAHRHCIACSFSCFLLPKWCFYDHRLWWYICLFVFSVQGRILLIHKNGKWESVKKIRVRLFSKKLLEHKKHL